MNASELAAKIVNDRGGIVVDRYPHRVEIVVKDYEDRADSATSVARALINQERIDALLGPQFSRHAIPVSIVAENAHMPMLSPMSSNPATTEGKTFVFRRPAVTITTPVKNDAGQTIAVVAGDLDLAYIDRLAGDRTGLEKSGEAYLVSPFNDFVSSARFGRDEFRRGVFSTGIDAALSGEHGVDVYQNYAGTPVIGAYRWNDARSLALLVEMGQAEAFVPARRMVVTILGIGLFSALMLAGGVYFIARQIARPVLEIAKAATAVADGDFTAVAPVS